MKEQQPTIAIAGATGFIGTNLRKFLNDKNIPTISLVRKNYRYLKFEKKLVFSDLNNKNLIQQLRRCDAFVHLIGIGLQTVTSDYQSVNIQITKKLVNLCKKSGIKKIVYISGLGVNKSTTFGYFISKLHAEQMIIESGLDYTILRASYIVGKNDSLTKNLRRQAKLGRIFIPGSGSYRLQPISINDVVKIILSCITNKRFSKKIINLVGPQTITFENFVRDSVKGKKTKIQKLPLEKAYFTALNNPKNATYGLDDLNILVGDFTANHKTLEKLCGFKLNRLDELQTSSPS